MISHHDLTRAVIALASGMIVFIVLAIIVIFAVEWRTARKQKR